MKLPSRKAGALVAASALALFAGVSTPSSAQQSPRTFSLPEPSPTPTPAPQGPADTRAGVQIGPRTIRTDSPAPTPTPTPRASSAPTPPPPTATPTPRASTTAPVPSSSATRPPSPPATAPGAPVAAPVPQTGDTVVNEPAPESTIDEAPLTAPEGSVSGPAFDPGAPLSTLDESSGEAFAIPLWAWFAGLATLLFAGLGVLLWRRRSGSTRRLPAPLVATDADSDTADLPPAELPRLDIALEIVSATRSVMMFTLDYRLNFSNRSDRAVRDLSISAQLASADRGSSNAPPIARGQPVGTIERIGPHQTRAISGQMQLPVTDIRAILQGRKPIFIPLLHLTLESPGQSAFTRTYVVGTPSAAAQGRLHPIPLDTPPGGVPGLKAREINVAV